MKISLFVFSRAIMFKKLSLARTGLFFIFFSFTVNAIAQPAFPSFRFPRYAFQFQMVKNERGMSFYPLTNSSFSGKIRLTNNAQLRLGVSIGDFKGKSTYQKFAENPSGSDTANIKTDFANLINGLFVQYLYFPRPQKRIKWYIGAGPELYASGNSRKSGSLKYELTKTIFGMGLVTGAEWLCCRNFSLNLEYKITVKYEKSRFTKTGSTTKDAIIYTSEKFNLSAENIFLGLSIYFDLKTKTNKMKTEVEK